MNNSNYNEYSLFFRKSNDKISKEKLFNHAKKTDISGYSFIFSPVSLLNKPLRELNWSMMRTVPESGSLDLVKSLEKEVHIKELKAETSKAELMRFEDLVKSHEKEEEKFLKKIIDIISKAEPVKNAEEIDISPDSASFKLLPSADSKSFTERGFRLQFFTWALVKKLAKDLHNDWTAYINTDDMKLQDEIDKIQATTTMDKFWDQSGKLIVSHNSSWPDNIIADPITYARIIFRSRLFDDQIEIKYGEHILMDNSFFNEKREDLVKFLRAYYEEIREEIII